MSKAPLEDQVEALIKMTTSPFVRVRDFLRGAGAFSTVDEISLALDMSPRQVEKVLGHLRTLKQVEYRDYLMGSMSWLGSSTDADRQVVFEFIQRNPGVKLPEDLLDHPRMVVVAAKGLRSDGSIEPFGEGYRVRPPQRAS